MTFEYYTIVRVYNDSVFNYYIILGIYYVYDDNIKYIDL